MLNSCAPGVSVVNIDNGYGAAHQAEPDQSPVAKIGEVARTASRDVATRAELENDRDGDRGGARRRSPEGA